MNIMIVGCGKVGVRLARILTEDGHDVSIIARSAAEVEKNLENDFSGSILCGVPIDQDNLKKAGIETCDVVCAVTDDDNTNIMVAQLAKELYGIEKVISRILDPERGDIFAHFGLETVCPTRLTVEAITSALKPVPDDRYLERYLRLYRTAKQFGITVVQENVCYCKSKSIEFLTKMSRELGDEVRFVIDLKQARRSGVDPFLLLNALGNKVIQLHVSDGNKECDCLPVGEGDFDFDRLMKHLQSLSYNGALVVELYRNNYEGYDELVHSANRLSRFASAYNFQISP